MRDYQELINLSKKVATTECDSMIKGIEIKFFNTGGDKVFSIRCYDNLLHFTMETLSDIIFYTEMKKFDPELKLHFNNMSVRNYNSIVNLMGMRGLVDLIVPDIVFSEGNNFSKIISLPQVWDSYRELYRFCAFENKIDMVMDIVRGMSGESYNKVYISRRVATGKAKCNVNRCLINEGEIVSLVESHGFKEVFLENYNFFNKLYLLHKADEIIVQSSASIILLSYIKNKKIIFLTGPYKAFFLPYEYETYHKYEKIYGTYEKSEDVNVCWKIDDLNDLIKKL